MSSFPQNVFTDLPFTTVVPDPDNKELFVPWLTRLYEDIATVVNQKDWTYYTIPIGTTEVDIPNIPNRGAFLICVSGVDDGMPGCTYSLIKNNSTSAGNPSLLQTEAGTAIGNTTTWLGVKLIITSSATNFQIKHNATAGTIGNFNIRFIGTM